MHSTKYGNIGRTFARILLLILTTFSLSGCIRTRIVTKDVIRYSDAGAQQVDSEWETKYDKLQKDYQYCREHYRNTYSQWQECEDTIDEAVRAYDDCQLKLGQH